MSRELKLQLRSLATVFVVLAMVFAFAISGVRLFGLQVYGVLTGSMEPAYPVGSLVYVKKVDPATLKVSDVITFSMSRNAVATHRIVEKVPDPDNPYSYSFRTKGDANSDVDASLVRQSSIIGKVVFSLPLMGHIASYIQNPPGTYVAILVSLVLIAFVFMTDNVQEQPANPKRKKDSASGGRMDALLKRYLPFLATKPANNDGMRQGYVPPAQPQPPQQYPPAPKPQVAYPQQPVYPRQPVQQYPQQPVQPYPQQYGQYPYPQQPQMPYQQPVYSRQPVQPYPQQYGQYPYPQQQQAVQPYRQTPMQTPYGQPPPRQDWPQHPQPRRSRVQRDG